MREQGFHTVLLILQSHAKRSDSTANFIILSKNLMNIPFAAISTCSSGFALTI